MPAHPSNARTETPAPLVVDLDGTLLRSDVLLESIFSLLKKDVFSGFLFFLWLLKGKAFFKQQIADRVDLDVTLLPYNQELVGFLKDQKGKGRVIVLATATNIKYARQIAAHFGLFDDVLASDATTNLAGRAKLERLLDSFGEKGFDYVANAQVDLAIWSHAGNAILVNPGTGVRAKAEKCVAIQRVMDDRKAGVRLYLKAVRLHQWLKNLLLFVPLLLAYQYYQLELLVDVLLAFLSFGFCASSVYVLNDLLDLPADRRHQTKRNRPLASGDLPIMHSFMMFPVLLVAGLILALLLPVEFQAVLLTYYVLTLFYSFRLKQSALIDVLILASLYTLRIIAGAAAVSVVASFWLLAFSMFLFMSLALNKRYSELRTLDGEQESGMRGRGYSKGDLEILSQFGTSSGYMAVLVLALYINSAEVKMLYSQPYAIWLLCPVLLYWISRIWLLAHRGNMQEDAILFALRDRTSHWLVILGLIILWVAR